MNLSNINDFHLNQLDEEKYIDCCYSSAFSYWNITNEKFLINYQSKFSKETLNEVMLRNIKVVTEKLKKVYKVTFATKLVLRLIFIRFIVDRGIDIGYMGLSKNVEQSQKRLIEIVSTKESLYKLFLYLKNKFNGKTYC